MPSPASRLMPTLRRVVLAGTAADRTDGQLLGAFVADRDGEAFGLLVRRHGPMVLGVCRRVIGDRTASEDAFQAVFLVLARRAAAVRPRGKVGNWLYGVAYRTALKARAVLARRRAREKQVEVMPEPPAPPAPDTWCDVQPIIDEELARLPEKLRLPVVLCDLEGRAQRDVARDLGLPPATLATRLASARRTLADRLTRRGVTLSGGALAGLLTVHGSAAAVPLTLTHGLVRAAEAVAAGGVGSGLVSAGAVQLSEGVMRMMLLAKLKVVAVTALTALALTGGLGLGLMPAAANGPGAGPGVAPADPSAPPAAPQARPVAKVAEVGLDDPEPAAPADDVTFFRRLSLDLRGVPPTDVETFFFVADEDDEKRDKVVVWMVDDDEVRDRLVKKAGDAAGELRVVRVKKSADGKFLEVTVEGAGGRDGKPQARALAFSPDGKWLAVEPRDPAQLKDHVVEVQLSNPGDKGPKVERRVVVGGQLLAADVTGGWVGPNPGFFRLAQDKLVEGRPLTVEIGDDKPGTVRLWNVADGKSEFALWAAQLGQPQVRLTRLQAKVADAGSDVEFLRRVLKDVRGTPPTALEERYFAEDTDPKKREKLLDELLKEPAVAKKLGDDWKKKMLADGPATTKERTFRYEVTPKIEGKEWKFAVPVDPKQFKFDFPSDLKEWKGEFKFVVPIDPKGDGPNKFFVQPVPPVRPTQPVPPKPPMPPDVVRPKFVPNVPQPPNVPKPPVPPQAAKPPAAPQADKLGKLIDALIAAKKTDAEMLEAVTLAVASRLPTGTEKRLTIALVAKAADRKAAWLEVAKALAADEGAGAAQPSPRSRSRGPEGDPGSLPRAK